MADLMQRVFEAEHDVILCGTAGEALGRLLGGESFDVILCDLMMPVMTGMEFHAALAQRDAATAARVIFLTGGAFTRPARAFVDAVPNVVLEKPLDMRTLRSLINDRLREAERTQEVRP